MQLTQEEKDIVSRIISNRVSICFFISFHLKDLLIGKIDIPCFIQRSEKEISILNKLAEERMDSDSEEESDDPDCDDN